MEWLWRSLTYMRRDTRLSTGFSRKLANYEAAVVALAAGFLERVS